MVHLLHRQETTQQQAAFLQSPCEHVAGQPAGENRSRKVRGAEGSNVIEKHTVVVARRHTAALTNLQYSKFKTAPPHAVKGDELRAQSPHRAPSGIG